MPRKNIREFHGQPMLSYPIKAAQESDLFSLIIVSTDDQEIAGVAFSLGCVVVPRPEDDGSTGTQEIAARILRGVDITDGAACVIYPTSPLLTANDLRRGWQELLTPRAKKFVRSVGADGQDAGCFYWGWARAFLDRAPLDAFNTIDLLLPAERVIDINTPEDWSRAESMFEDLRRAS